MPRVSRCKCVECDKSFDANQMREVGGGLLRLFLAARLSIRISFKDSICQKCRQRFLRWREKMEGDFDTYDNHNEAHVELVNNDDSNVRTQWFFFEIIDHVCQNLIDNEY